MYCSLSLCLPKALRLTLYEAERYRGDGLEAHSVRDSDVWLLAVVWRRQSAIGLLL